MASQLESELARLLELDVRYGYIDGETKSPRRDNPQIIVNGSTESMLRALRRELATCEEFAFSVAFLSAGAIALLKQEFVEFGKSGMIVTSDYLGFNRPEAFAELRALSARGIDGRFHSAPAYHPKGYLFRHADRFTAILGSSNLTKPALTINHEWNLRVSAAFGSDLAHQLEALIDQQRELSTSLSDEWVESYREAFESRQASAPPPRMGPLVARGAVAEPLDASAASLVFGRDQAVQPNTMQREALDEIAKLRASGARRGVVISATGTGKTVLAALDVRAARPQRVLFVVHREQILDRAIEEFKWVLGADAAEFGKLAGGRRDLHRRFTFASIQTLSQPETLSALDPATFDYILVDEVHRAGAASYLRVLEHFTPSFLLGMTATPERTDGFNVFELFDYNVPYEIRLNRALEDDMLCPFHYYGVADATFDDGTVAAVDSGLDQLTSALRVEHIAAALETYGQAGVAPRGLVFCARTEEAVSLAAQLTGRTVHGRVLRCVALTGATPIPEREDAVRRLESGEIEYIFTVDIFNEGIDIPQVNQVVMLRQTQSAIVFVQQLGRGLRKAQGKDYVVVIDFIGNYANNYLIPVALFGDESLNRESLRQKLIAAEETGIVAGLSSVRFDKISQQRVLASIATTKLDSVANLRAAFDTLRNRLGQPPKLLDFWRFDSADPGVVATRWGTYPDLVARFTGVPHRLGVAERNALTLLSHEVLVAKRPHEALVVRELTKDGSRTVEELVAAVQQTLPSATRPQVESALAALDLTFGTEQERGRYRAPLVSIDGDEVILTPAVGQGLDENPEFASAVEDLIETTLAMTGAKYDASRPFTPGRQYSRKDATRLLSWGKNVSSTIYGYKVDRATGTCPVFVTMHKADDVSASTAYDDGLIDNHSMRWFTRSRRTLASEEVRLIVANEVDIHVFAQKDDAEGSDFYYLGQARAEGAVQDTMLDDHGAQLSVVKMTLRFDKPIEGAVYDYFHPVVTL